MRSRNALSKFLSRATSYPDRSRHSRVALLVILLMVLSSLAHGVPLKVGFGEFDRESMGGSPSGSALFSLMNPEGILVSEAGVEATSPIQQGRLFVQQTTNIGTGLAFANPSDHPVLLELVLRNQEGHEVGRKRDFKVEPHQHLARFISELFEDISNPFLGSLTFSGISPTDRVAAVTLRQSNNSQGEPLLTTLPVVALSGSESPTDTPAQKELIFPHIGAGPGFSTQLILINRSEVRSSGSVYLVSSDGTDLQLQMGSETASRFTFDIAPGGVSMMEFLPPGTSLGVGYVKIEVEAGSLPAGTAIFRFTAGGNSISEAGVGAPPAMGKARLFVDTRDTSTGVALVNPHSHSIKLTLRLYDANGLLIEELSRSLAAENHFSQFAGEIFDLPNRFAGMIEIECPDFFVPITLKLSQNRRKQSILTTLPVANMSTPDSASVLVFPQIATGDSVVGQFLTRLIFIAPLQEQPVVGTLKFWEGVGSPLTLELIRGELTTAIEGGAVGELIVSDRPPPTVIRKGVSVSREIDSSGGEVVLEDCGGSRVSLEVPPFAISSPRRITMNCLQSRPVDTLGTNLFPGISLEPDGLLFLHPLKLTVLFPQAIENVHRTAITTLGPHGIPRPALNSNAAGQLLTGEIHHFSEYWGDEVNFHDLLKWVGLLGHAMQDPVFHNRAAEIFSNKMGFDLDPDALDLLIKMADINDLRGWEVILDSLNFDVERTGMTLSFLEELVMDALAKPIPSNPCGQFHSAVLTLRKIYEGLIGPHPALTDRMAALDTQCVRIDLTGWWRNDSDSQTETCWYPNDPFSPWTETEQTESYRFRISQTGSLFIVSFPDYPGAPTLSGQLHGTGSEKISYYFTFNNSGANSVDCYNFFQTNGSFEFGDPLCEEDENFGCEALSCYESEWIQGLVSEEGTRLYGDSKWIIGASALQVPKIAPCDPAPCIASISCEGSGFFTWRKVE